MYIFIQVLTAWYLYFLLYITKTFIKLLLMNDWPECLDIYHGAFFWQGVSSLFKWSPWSHNISFI